MTVRIKICGITNEVDALAAARLGADAIGFVFAPSPRRVTAERAKEIISRLPPLTQTVGVFVNEDPDKVESLARFCGLDLLQLHGEESAAYCSRFSRRVIKALRLRSQDELQWLAEFRDVADALLLDTYVPEQCGGTGLTFDWNLAVQARGFGRVILAGGLNPENVASAIQTVEPYAVDASSGLEREPGLKDHQKMARFIEKVHQAAR